MTDRSVELSEWRRPDGGPSTLGKLPVVEDEFAPPGAFDDLEPDEEHFREASGNEGATFERTYSRAALVLWPRRRRFAVLCQAGLSVTLPALEELAQRAANYRRAAEWQEAHELASHMIEQWPTVHWYPRPDTKPGNAARMLELLTRLADTDGIEAFIARVTAAGVYGKGDNEAVLSALGLLPTKRQTALLELIVDKTAATSFSACADLLTRAAATISDLGNAARRLVDAMPGDPARFVPEQPWHRPQAMEPATAADVLTALVAIDRTLAERAVAYMLAWPKTLRSGSGGDPGDAAIGTIRRCGDCAVAGC